MTPARNDELREKGRMAEAGVVSARHSVRIEFDRLSSFPRVVLIHEEPEKCEPGPPDECILSAWISECGDELLDGDVTVPVEVEWGGPDEGPSAVRIVERRRT